MSETTQDKKAWSSGLSTNDFAACVASGLRPLGYVQGCSVVNWSFYGQGYSGMGFRYGTTQPQPSGYYESYNCPHGFISAEHRTFGLNYQKSWVEAAYLGAFRSANERLVNEAAQLGAHGIIGVIDRTVYHPETVTFEFTLSGTAVGIDGVAVPATPFTTFLAGQKLNKLIEAGFAPVEISVGISAIGVMASCITEFQLNGGGNAGLGIAGGGWGAVPSGEIEQVVRAHIAARTMVRDQVRKHLSGDILHGAKLTVQTHETQEGPQIDAMLHGNRVRHFKEFAKMDLPRPVVKLADR
jgi:hypothetical protein